MQIEQKLQVGALALLLSLVALAGPVNSQVDPTNCVPTIPPFPPAAPDPTCAGDPGVPPAGCDPTDPPTCAPIPPGGLDLLCALNPDPVDPTFPGCLEELGPTFPPEGVPPEGCGVATPDGCADLTPLDQLCALNEEATVPTFPDCLLELNPDFPPEGFPPEGFPPEGLPEGCAPTTPDGCVPEAPVGLDLLCTLNPEAADPTFPNCFDDFSPPAGLPEGCDPTDPSTCAPIPPGPTLPEGCDPEAEDFPQEACADVPEPDASVLDVLCPILNDAAVDPTFPNCALELLDGLPDPTAENTPPSPAAGGDQNVDEGDLVTLDGTGSSDADGDSLDYVWDCPGQTLSNAMTATASFTAPPVTSLTAIVCTLTVDDGTTQAQDTATINVADTNVAPVVDAGSAEQTVNEGVSVLLDGTATDAETLTTDWSCDPVQTLGSATSVDTSFIAPSVDEDGLDIVCTLSADDGDLSSSDATTIHVVDVPDPVDVVLTFSIDTLASQGVDNTVLVTGTVMSNVDLAGADIGIALANAQTHPLAGHGAENVVYSADNVDSIDLAAGEAESFEAQVTWSAFETVKWTITVADGSFTFPVTFAADATYIDFGAGNAPASLALAGLSTASYSPDNVAASDLTSVLTVTDENGAGDGFEADYGRIVDANIVVGIASDSDAVSAVIGAGVNEVADPALSRDFGVTVSLPARLKDDTYTLTASYTNPIAGDETVPDLTDAVTRTLAVENVAPVIEVLTPGAFVGTARVASFGLVSFSVDDFNAGTLNGGAVTELDSLSLAVRDAAGGACSGTLAVTGFSLGFPDDNVEGATLDLSDVAFSAAIPVVASLSWATTAVAGDYELCATLSDGALSDADVLLATFDLTALNEGFFLTVDDGGNGLSAPGADPNHSTTTEALSIVLSGTLGADELILTVGNFQRDPGPLFFTAQNLHGKLCLAATCLGDDVIAEVAGSSGIVTFTDLSAVALPGVELFVVFDFTVPLGTAAGNYAAPISVAGHEAP